MKTTNANWELTLHIPPKVHAVAGVRKVLNSFFQMHQLRAQMMRHLNLVINEALNNAIENRKARSTKPIELQIKILPHDIWLAIRGESDKSGYQKLQQAMSHADLLDMDGERGRGLFLMQTLMDEVGLQNLSGHRTEIWMRKSLG